MIASLGNIQFRINPSQVHWEYSIDTAVINTIGGRVVQVYGATLGDMTIQGLFGQPRDRGHRESWELAEQFATDIGKLIQQQSTPPTAAQLQGTDPTPMHQPFRFFYDDTAQLGAAGHLWDFQVYVKSLADVRDPAYVVSHRTGKFSYGYTLTLFVVEAASQGLQQAAVDDFIKRLADGVGWQRTLYNGPMNAADLQAYLAANSPDGTIHGLVLKEFKDAGTGKVPQVGQAANPVPGGAGMLTGGAGALSTPPPAPPTVPKAPPMPPILAPPGFVPAS